MALKTHIDNWITKAEPDYYTMFIKAWIPLNAWYVNEYPSFNKSDTAIIKELKLTNNKIRGRIESLLKGSDVESKKFRHDIGQLHIELHRRSLYHNGKKLSFSSVLLDDVVPKPVHYTDPNGNSYQAAKGTGFYQAMIVNGKKTFLDIKLPQYDLNGIITHPQYVALPRKQMREKIKKLFEQINPQLPIDLVTKSVKKSDYIELDTNSKLRYINDTETIAKSIIQTIYYLRCMLFHGELDPTITNSPVYEYSFYILKSIIQELK